MHFSIPLVLPMSTSKTVCVTGGSGFLGSYIVKLLLEKGYRVKTTVRDVTDAKKVDHLRALPGATDRLELFQADLLQEGSFDAAIEGCSGVFHTASPFFMQNQTREALGTLNVLRSCARHESVRRVIVTSSTAAVYVHLGTKPAGHIFTEADWSNVEGMEKAGMWYCVSKTVAERSAFEFITEQKPAFDIVSMCPTMIFGPMLQPTLNESSQLIHNFFSGVTKTIANGSRAVVDVRDVAAAHIAGLETPSASGRYILVSTTTDDFEIRDAVRKADPAANLPADEPPAVRATRTLVDTTKAQAELGVSFRPLEEMVQGTVDSLHQLGFAAMATKVCVTGGSGFLGSYVVKRLLEKGYYVKTTVRDVNNTAKTAHLRALPGAADRLELVEADLLTEGAFDAAVLGCDGVFHTASPLLLKTQTRESLITPAVQGTLNVLRSCTREPRVRRVVLTSSVAAVYIHCGTKPSDHIFTEADWSPKDQLEANELWYPLSKTLAEEAAHAFVAEQKPAFDLVALNPAWIFGPMLQQSLNDSSEIVHKLFGAPEIANVIRNVVDVRDVADAHVAAFESPKATGRYLLIASSNTEAELCASLRRALPAVALKLPTQRAAGDEPTHLRFDCSKAKADLGIDFLPLDDTLRETGTSLIRHGFLKTD
ncbi:hypothetical protein ACHHYP_04501 [Achlya hypogyna]|uniref:NAD-dependent epimerase/dehydratase domain-containing protein n=1 Tax=Achlya hypogyna TaxID=1202772 RepID=A0A1V9Z0X4_ACHHY|nr:hypothetical protein ACHHYP_04501 [Achlya hypogyna]